MGKGGSRRESFERRALSPRGGNAPRSGRRSSGRAPAPATHRHCRVIRWCGGEHRPNGQYRPNVRPPICSALVNGRGPRLRLRCRLAGLGLLQIASGSVASPIIAQSELKYLIRSTLPRSKPSAGSIDLIYLKPRRSEHVIGPEGRKAKDAWTRTLSAQSPGAAVICT